MRVALAACLLSCSLACTSAPPSSSPSPASEHAPGAAPPERTHDGPRAFAELELLRRFEAAGVRSAPLRLGLRAYACGRARGEFEAPLLTLIDYAQPSSERRLWVLDLAAGSVRFHEYVTHGSQSGMRLAARFSNEPGSRQSSLGLFRTGSTYLGRRGYSLRLVGLEPRFNDLARERGIVMHGAAYATPEFAERFGRLGRSWGCPALDPAVHRQVIDTIRGGTALFAYYPEVSWLASSSFLHCEAPPLSQRDLARWTPR